MDLGRKIKHGVEVEPISAPTFAPPPTRLPGFVPDFTPVPVRVPVPARQA